MPIPRRASPLEVPGHEPASHAGPLDVSRPQPLVAVLHGNYDRPEWECDSWRDIVRAGAWVLCTRGVRREGTTLGEDRWTYRSPRAALAELRDATAVLRARYAGKVQEGVQVLAGLSLGAYYARQMAIDEPARFGRVVLIEGGGGGWTDATARRFVRGGGRRVVFACGQAGCAREARRAIAAIERARGQARLIYDREAGHNYSDRMLRELSESYRWINEPEPPAAAARTP